jgi:MYXO-CTERM domain-containing protein
MTMKRYALAVASLLTAGAITPARADIPVGYKGMPYKGTPTPIPGRVNLADYDLGGTNVSYMTNHTAPATSAPNYRTDTADHALIYITSEVGGLPNNPVPDKYTAGPMMGTFYPGGGVKDYYIGATHPGDWVSVTVNVMTAGTYDITSTWSSGGPSIEYKIFFNDLMRATPIIDVKLPTTGDYHNWVPDTGPHTVQLTAGVQVMTFQTVVQHLNMDYLQLSLTLPDGGVVSGNDDGGTGSDAAATSGSSASTGSTAGSGAGSGTPIGSTGASSGTDATSGNATSGSIAGGSGAAGGGTGAGTSGSAGSGASGGSRSVGTPGQSSGCACSVGARSSGAGAWLLALGTVVLVRRRRQTT